MRRYIWRMMIFFDWTSSLNLILKNLKNAHRYNKNEINFAVFSTGPSLITKVNNLHYFDESSIADLKWTSWNRDQTAQITALSAVGRVWTLMMTINIQILTCQLLVRAPQNIATWNWREIRVSWGFTEWSYENFTLQA